MAGKTSPEVTTNILKQKAPPPAQNLNPFLPLAEFTGTNPFKVVGNPNQTGNPKAGQSNGENNGQVQKQLQGFIKALKFDPSIDVPPKREAPRTDSMDSFLEERYQKPAGKKSLTAKSKAVVTAYKKSLAGMEYLDSLNHNQRSSPAMDKSQQRLLLQQRMKESGTPTVIRDWGKRPMLVESEAPWTPRNRMYCKAVKALGVRPQDGLTFPQMLAQQQQLQRLASTGYPGMRPGTNLPVPTPNGIYLPPNFPQPKMPIMANAIQQQSPYLAGISGLPNQDGMGNMPMAVAIESPFPYQQEMVFPVQQQQQQQQQFPQAQPQTMMFGHLDSQGLWMPLIAQQHYQQHMLQKQQQERQQQMIQQQQQQQQQIKIQQQQQQFLQLQLLQRPEQQQQQYLQRSPEQQQKLFQQWQQQQDLKQQYIEQERQQQFLQQQQQQQQQAYRNQ